MKPHEPSKPMRQMLKKILQEGQEVDGEAVLKAAFPGGSSGSWAASAAGREAMPGTVTVPGDLERNLIYLEVLLNDTLNILENAGAKPLAEGDLASQPTPRTEALEDGEGVSAGRTFPAPGLVAAHKPDSHRRGPPRGNTKATGVMKPHEPSKPMRQMLKKILQEGQEVDGEAVLKAAFPGGSSGSWAASAAGREAMPGTVPGDEVPRKDSPLDWLHKVLKPLEPPAGVSAGRTFPDPLLITARKPGSHRRGPPRGKNRATGQKEPLESHHILKEIEKELLTGRGMDREALWKAAFPEGREAIAGTGPGTGDAAGTTRVPNSQKGIRRGFCQGTRCWLELMAGLLCLVHFFVLCGVGIWYACKRKQSASAPSDVRPNSSVL
ncbi:uncharacterized protein LOC111941942 [Cyanistes caeruleus]|uniref:uncharacterized protein LOC111941942 n=1 Tax=Cyanistes caeruleus TaxID=156563 RepID=UPI000CDB7927|nr:uncharacterized protein LOC111941942 [Cyanistes caeruleus]